MPTVPSQEFRFTKRRLLERLLPAAKICLLCAPLVAVERTRTAGLITLALVVLLLLFLLASHGHGIAVRLDANGLCVTYPGFGMLLWSDIEAVRFVRIHGIAHLVIDRTHAARAVRRGGFLLRRAAKRVGARDLAVPLVGLQDDPKKVAEVVSLALAIANGHDVAVRR